jgi:hypothetical protein
LSHTSLRCENEEEAIPRGFGCGAISGLCHLSCFFVLWHLSSVFVPRALPWAELFKPRWGSESIAQHQKAHAKAHLEAPSEPSLALPACVRLAGVISCKSSDDKALVPSRSRTEGHYLSSMLPG